MDQIPILLRPAPTLEGLPLELMYMVLNAYKKDEYCPRTYILEQSDLCNLRLVSRRVHETTLHDFGKRIFTSRKHMLSRYSLYALRDISRHATFRHYVREVTIGPERVNPDFIGKDRDLTFSEDEVTEEDGNLSETETFPDGSDQESNDDDTAVLQKPYPPWCPKSATRAWLSSRRRHVKMITVKRAFVQWKYKYLRAYERLVQDQAVFDAEVDVSNLLSLILKNFPELQLVRIDPFQTYPEADGQVSWVQPWGAATICRQVGWEPFQCTVDYFRQLDFRSGYAYVGGILADTSHGRSMLHRHYPIILKAIARAQVSQSSFSAGNSLLCTLRSSVVQRSPQTLAWPLTVTPHL